ncbi:MAG: acyl-CoA dehydrogenase [Proteobacteria bacterium]|nr:acyl-CoA dehydrogenase [Pseudomonadota bacterium]
MIAPHTILLFAPLAFLLLAFFGRAYLAWVAAGAIALFAWYGHLQGIATPAFNLGLGLFAAVAVITGCPLLRRHSLTKPLMRLAAKSMPTIGETERIALEAGGVFFEQELFSGKPDWSQLKKFTVKPLTEEEQAFLAGPTEALCKMLNDDEIFQKRDLSPKVWAFIKKHKFLGMIIPVEHGGLGFSAAAHAAVITRIASRSVATAVTVMVPNSLGPGELLLRYGTTGQRNHYLPRLANGEEIPCFALTEPTAGSDAANGQSFGIVTMGKWQGKEVMGISLTFNKRYITLAPIATVVGLAFHLYDPKHLLGEKDDIGITCALLPRKTPGLVIGSRHDPMGIPFMNGPVSGTNVFVPMDVVIGGREQVGNGWRMLMECLAAGRGISLPSLSVGAAQVSVRAAAAYASVREQFNLPIGKFEGVRERLARLAANAFYMTATRNLTAGAVDAGTHPAVASAIAKAYLTEGMRASVNHAMDVMAGASIQRGPRNILARPYASIPIGITVEGANILSRSLIVFGQGAIRCHPYLQAEVAAVAAKDLKGFDKAFFGHIGHVIRNAVRALVLALIPAHSPHARLSRYSAAFAFLADVGLVTLGGAMKRKEYLSGRYADAFAWLYIASATLKQHASAGSPHNQAALLTYVLTMARVEVEQALNGVLRNLPNRPAAWLARLVIFPLGRHAQLPTDRLTDKVVSTLLDESTGLRTALSPDVYLPAHVQPGLAALEDAHLRTVATAASRKKVAEAIKEGYLHKAPAEELAHAAVEKGLLSVEEGRALLAAEQARLDVIQVDSFPKLEFNRRR